MAMTQDADPLAPFRAPGARSLSAPLPARPRSGYQAFFVAMGASRPTRLEIRPKTGMAVARPYNAISEIAYDRGVYTGILLVLPGKLIKIRGRGLKPIVEAVIAGACECLVEIKDGDQVAEGVPVIESIEVLTPQPKPEGGS
jgi:hypothetical protein